MTTMTNEPARPRSRDSSCFLQGLPTSTHVRANLSLQNIAIIMNHPILVRAVAIGSTYIPVLTVGLGFQFDPCVVNFFVQNLCSFFVHPLIALFLGRLLDILAFLSCYCHFPFPGISSSCHILDTQTLNYTSTPPMNSRSHAP